MHPNVWAHLQRAGFPFTLHNHADCTFPIKSPKDFAQALGYPIERITKSMFLAAGAEHYVIAVCSINRKGNFAPLSALLGWGRLEVASQDVLDRVTDYPSHGVSPLGVVVPIFVDSRVMTFDTVLVGAGQVGLEIEISPLNLVAATSAIIVDFTRP